MRLKAWLKVLLGVEERRFTRYARTWVEPRGLPPGPDVSTVATTVFGDAGIDLNVAGQLALLAKLGERKEFFERLRGDLKLNVSGTPERIANGMFHSPDAEIYGAMILEFAPNRIVEIGSGFSTRVARQSLRELGSTAPLVVVDPEPRANVEGLADRHLKAFFEEVSVEDLGLAAGSLLFIDTSHICRAGGDLPKLFCQLIPALPAGVLVQVHDIFIPFEYPVCYQRALYNEQYLLHAYLAHNPRCRVLLASQYLSQRHAREMQAAISPEVGKDTNSFGASFWFETV